MSDRHQEDFDRTFTEMVSGLRMAEWDTPRTPPAADPPDLREIRESAPEQPDVPEPTAAPPEAFNLTSAMAAAEPDEPEPSDYLPPPLPPLRRPRGWAALGWGCAAYVLAALMLTIVGVRLPGWAGWLAVVAFVAAIGIGWRSLPKDRDPDDDGAVV